MKKERMKFKKLLLLCLGLAVFVSAGFSQTYTESKKIIRSFPVYADTRLDVSNKYGKIHVMPWKKDSVRIEIDLFVRSTSMHRLDKLMDNIEFELTGTNYYIIADTRFASRYNTFFSDLRDLSGNIIPSNNDVEINYTIMVPSNMIINLSNKFGDIYIDDLKGTVTVSLSNGDIKVNRLEGQSNINLNFGNGIINYLNNATINLVYADLEIKEAGQLSLETKSSEIRIYEVDILKTRSSRDKYVISELNNLFGDSYFSDIWIYKMNEEVNFTPRYGDFKIDSVSNHFSYININSEYADLYMIFNRASSWFLDIHYHPDVAIRIPEDLGNLEVINEDTYKNRLTGKIGESTSSSRVEISAPKKCIITIDKRRNVTGSL